MDGRGKKTKGGHKDAAADTPIKDEDGWKETSEEDASRITTIEKELNGIKDDVN